MTRSLCVLVGGLAILCFPAPAKCQESHAETSPRYRIIEVKKFKDLQRELDQAAASGDRLVWADDFLDMLIVEKSPEPSVRREYQVLRGFDLEALRLAGESGFHYLRDDRNSGAFFLERRSDSSDKYDYALLKTNRTSTLESEMAEGVSKGFRVVWAGLGMTYIVMMEKTFTATRGLMEEAATENGVKLLATEHFSTMRRELAETAAQGYRVTSGFLAGEILFVLEKNQEADQRFEYEIVVMDKPTKLEIELNNMALRGFRLVPLATMTDGAKVLIGEPTTVAVMEKDLALQATYEYRVRKLRRKFTQRKQDILDTAAKGYELATVSRGDRNNAVFIFERARRD